MKITDLIHNARQAQEKHDTRPGTQLALDTLREPVGEPLWASEAEGRERWVNEIDEQWEAWTGSADLAAF